MPAAARDRLGLTTVHASRPAPALILHVCPSFYPATRWGGPIVSTRAICDGMADHDDIAVMVLSTDAAGPGRHDRLEVGRGAVRFPAGYDVVYARRVAGRDISPELVARLLPMMRQADVVHLTGTYSFPTLPTLALAKLLRKPLLWSPRGALQARREWAAADRRRKVVFEAMCRAAMPRRALFHATSEAEATLSCEAIPGVRAVVVPNAVDLPELSRDVRASGEKLLFLSRLHPKKGIDTLLDALALLPAEVTLDVCGAGEPAYRAALQHRTERLGLESRVRFRGHVDGSAKSEAFRAADVFVLPSYSENFGIVVAEALAHALPVVTTTITPWDETVRAGCGLRVPCGRADALAEVLRTLLRRTRDERAAMGAAGQAFVAARYGRQAIAERMRAVYLELAA